MVRVVTQETFDLVVKENMEEFEMNHEDAVKEAKEQFEQQGVNLSNIVVGDEDGKHKVVKALERISGGKLSETDLQENLNIVASLCKDDLAQRVLATNNDGYNILVNLAKENTNIGTRTACLQALTSVMDTNPDHLEINGAELLVTILNGGDKELRGSALDWLLVCCVRHEQNRVNFVKGGILDALDLCLEDGGRDELLRVCRVWMALVQDDDVRVPFGKAHDHARDIVEHHNALSVLTRALTTHNTDHEILNLCLASLASLSVRNEYCQEVVDEGGLQFLHDVLLNHQDKHELVNRSLQLLKTLAGNDQVKCEISKAGGIPLIMGAIQEHLTKPKVVEAGLNAITAVCLRSPENAGQVMESEGAYLITTAMSRHPANGKVQASAAAAIRNIVSRERVYNDQFINLDAESLLNDALNKHKDQVGDTLRSALRDLGLEVELQERWLGSKAGIEVWNEDYQKDEKRVFRPIYD